MMDEFFQLPPEGTKPEPPAKVKANKDKHLDSYPPLEQKEEVEEGKSAPPKKQEQ